LDYLNEGDGEEENGEEEGKEEMKVDAPDLSTEIDDILPPTAKLHIAVGSNEVGKARAPPPVPKEENRTKFEADRSVMLAKRSKISIKSIASKTDDQTPPPPPSEIFHSPQSSPTPPTRPSLSTLTSFPISPRPPLTVDVVLQRKMMLHLCRGADSQKTQVYNEFWLPVIKSDMASFKSANSGRAFEDFKPYLTESYPAVPYDVNILGKLFEKTDAVAPSDQECLYDPDAEIEKILNFLSNIPPYVLFNQLLSMSYANSLFALMNAPIEHSDTTDRVLRVLKRQLDVTCDLLRREVEEGECVTEMREECIIDRETLSNCDKACDMLEAADVYVSRVLSLGNKTGVWDVVEFDFDSFKCKGVSGEFSSVMPQGKGDGTAFETILEFLKEERGGKREPDEIEMCAIGDGTGENKIAGRCYVSVQGGGKGIVYSATCKR